MQRRTPNLMPHLLAALSGVILLLTSALIRPATASSDRALDIEDFWRLPHLQGRISAESADNQWKSPYFWEVSYYQFFDPEKQIGGNINIFVLAPRYNPKLTVIGNIHKEGRQTEFFRQFPLSEVWMDPTSPSVIASQGSDRIEILDSGSRLRFNVEEVSADLYIDAPIELDWLTQYRFPQTADLSRVSPSALFDYQLTWLPLSPKASFRGKLRTDSWSAEIKLSPTQGYHDRLWGVWNPGAQPYQWVSFRAHNQEGKTFEGLVGYFPGLQDFGGAWIQDDEHIYFCDPSKIRMNVTEETVTVPTRFNPLEDSQVFHRNSNPKESSTAGLSESSRLSPPKNLELTLTNCRAPNSKTTLSGSVELEAYRFDAKGLDLPANLGSLLFNDFSIADLDATLNGSLSLKTPGYQTRKINIIGTASLQAISGQ